METEAPARARCVILGGGGHAKVLLDCLQSMGTVTAWAILDVDPLCWGLEVSGVPVLGGDELLPKLVQAGVTHFVVGIGSVGDSRPRQRVFELGKRHGLQALTVQHPSAVRSQGTTIGEGSMLFPLSVVNAGSRVGVDVIVNTGAIVEHDCVIGDHAHVAVGATVCGLVQVGRGAHLGAGATVRQSLVIGEGAVVGAGAVVVHDVEPWTVVAGVPARRIRDHRQGPMSPAVMVKQTDTIAETLRRDD